MEDVKDSRPPEDTVCIVDAPRPRRAVLAWELRCDDVVLWLVGVDSILRLAFAVR
jgi:hypothetical protein